MVINRHYAQHPRAGESECKACFRQQPFETRIYCSKNNNVRLNSAIGYITPKDMLAGHQQEIQAERDRKLEAAREQRKNRRQRAA
jgi:hypothetical protein